MADKRDQTSPYDLPIDERRIFIEKKAKQSAVEFICKSVVKMMVDANCATIQDLQDKFPGINIGFAIDALNYQADPNATLNELVEFASFMGVAFDLTFSEFDHDSEYRQYKSYHSDRNRQILTENDINNE